MGLAVMVNKSNEEVVVKKRKRANRGILRCLWCGAPLEETVADYDMINPGGAKVIVVNLCDECFKKYRELVR